MFEKEAEEYKDNTRIKDKNTYIGFPDECISEVQDYEGNYIDISERIIKTFKDGAEFGYNKANEWHFVKDGINPTHSYRVISDKVIKKIIEIIGQEEWHELHDENNDVCTTMGELIITLKGITELEKENAELKEQIGDVIECFTSSSIGDDFEMAESAREVMEVLNMQCYRHGKVKSKLTEAKEIIRALLFHLNKDTFAVIYETKKESIEKAEDFLKENK